MQQLDVIRFAAVAAALVAAAAPARADETTRLSNALSGAAGAGSSSDPTLSADGTVVAFVSSAGDLIAGDTNFARDVFVLDLATGALTRVSVASDGSQSNGDSYLPVLSGDGRFIAFESVASNLALDPNGIVPDVFVHDRADGTTRLVSLDPAKAGGNGPSSAPSISRDGGRIAFHTTASNLLAGDANQAQDVLVLDGAGWHTEPLAVPEGIRLVFLPPYTPELQPAETLWTHVDEPLANEHFDTLADLDAVVAERCVALGKDRDLLRGQAGFHWWPKRIHAN